MGGGSGMETEGEKKDDGKKKQKNREDHCSKNEDGDEKGESSCRTALCRRRHDFPVHMALLILTGPSLPVNNNKDNKGSDHANSNNINNLNDISRPKKALNALFRGPKQMFKPYEFVASPAFS